MFSIVGYDTASGKTRIVVNSKYYRPCEVEDLLGDSTKARQVLGWSPEYDLEGLVKDMVDHDCPLETT